MNIKELEGEVLSYVDIDDDQIMLTTQSGKRIKIYHEQNCCESVVIADTEGDLHELIGKVIVETEEEVESDTEPKPYEHSESWTRTNHTFKTDNDTVIVRWIGESNGYYSETATIKELAGNEH